MTRFSFFTSLSTFWAIALVFLSVTTAVGQSEPALPPECEDDESVRTDPFTHLDTIPDFSYCYPLNMAEVEAIVLYQNYAKVSFRFEEGEDWEAPVFYRQIPTGGGSSSGNGALITVINGAPGQLTHLNFPHQQQYQLLTLNSCGDTIPLADFSTQTEYMDMVTVPKPLFEAVMNWTKHPQGQDIYALIANLPELSIQRKTAFLQQFLKTEALPSMYDGVLPPRSAFVPVETAGEDCRCRTMNIRAAREISPKKNFTSDGVIYPQYGSNEYKFPGNPSRGRIRWDFSYAGPARWQNLDGATSRCRNNSEGRTWNGLTPSAGLNDTMLLYYASLRFGQACFDANWDPSNCQCKQQVRLRWRYNSYIEAFAQKQNGKLCLNMPGRKALAAVDDAAMVSIIRREAQDEFVMQFVDFTRATAVSECERDFDEKRILDLVKLGFNLFAYSKGSKINSGIPVLDTAAQTIWKTYYKDNIVDDLTNLLTKPWVIKKGKCATENDNASMMRSRIETLEGNDEFEAILSASTFMEVEGLTHWRSQARLISGYSFSGVLLQNFVTPPSEYCCTRSYGSYSTKSMFSPGDPFAVFPQDYRENIGGNFNHPQSNFFGILPFNSVSGVFVISNDIGEVHGQPIPGCNTLINGREESRELDLPLASPYFLTLSNRNLWLVNQKSETAEIAYRVIDMQGRVLRAGRDPGNELLLYQFGSAPSGVYLVQIEREQYAKTFKIFVP